MDRDPVIAIVGMGCAFPQAHSPEAFWDLIRAGRDTVTPASPSRWGVEPARLYKSGDPSPDRAYALAGCFVDDTALALDWQSLHVDPDSVSRLDPLFKVGLYAAQQAWQATKTNDIDVTRTGVLIGNIVLPSQASSALTREILGNAYLERLEGQEPRVEFPQTDERNRFVAGLPAGFIANAMGFGGTCFTLDAACASSLYAIHMAAETLRAGRADAMITGGLSRPDSLYTQMGFSQLRALSSKGFSTPFDARADGLIVGEGAGMFVLKRLDDALAHGDTIHGIIDGAGLSNDRDGSLLAPSSEGQLRAMGAAYAQAGWRPDEVSMIECHATGTLLGDRVEFESMQELWQNASSQQGAVIGSVKSNIGHLLTAAGSASLMKVLLAMRHKTLPPTAGFSQTAPGISLQESPFRVLQEPEPWLTDEVKKAAVSAFGFGGINAHLLVSSWEGQAQPENSGAAQPAQPIAVVGMAARFGSLSNNHDLARVLLGLEEEPKPESLASMGLPAASDLKGFPVHDLDVPLGAFRIPPNELREMLPQQVLALELSRLAIADAGLNADEMAESGVFLGIGLDANTANFQLRWYLEKQLSEKAEALGSEQDEEAKRAWLQQLKDGLGPALNANRVIGSLGGMVASRVAREFRIGGPSFTLSSEDTSGLSALEAAVRALHNGRLSSALVGAVDFACDPRQAAALEREHGLKACDGGAVFVLKRLSDAVKAGDTIYATVDGVGSAYAGINPEDQTPTNAAENARADAQKVLKEAGTENLLRWKNRVADKTQKLGHAGAAQGFRNLLTGIFALHHRLKPGAEKSQYWLRNRIQGPRRLLVETTGIEGSVFAVQLAEHESSRKVATLAEFAEAVFTFGAADRSGLVTQLRELLGMLEKGASLQDLAQAWWQQRKEGTQPYRLALLARNEEELRDQIASVTKALQAEPDTQQATDLGDGLSRNKSVFFSGEPAVDPASVAFVFPGSGSQFPEMGRLLGLHFPHIFDAQDRLTQHFADQLRPDLFWSNRAGSDLYQEHRALLSAQVALGVTTHDIIGEFGLDPRGVIGYSLGESSALFATRAWTARDEMHQRTQDSALFQRLLAGPCEAVHQSWGLPADETVDWMLGVVNRPADEVKAAIENEARVYLLIVNTPGECVIGGQRDRVQAVVESLEARIFPLHGVVTVHCEVLEPAADAYHAHHLFETTTPEGVAFYSGGLGKRFEVTRENAADAILTQARHGVDFPKTIHAAYADGFRVFVEMGPGASCTRMIAEILKDKPHHALSVSKPGPKAMRHLLRSLARLHSLGLPVTLDPLFLGLAKNQTEPATRNLTLPIGRTQLTPPWRPEKKKTVNRPMTQETTVPRQIPSPGVAPAAARPQPAASPQAQPQREAAVLAKHSGASQADRLLEGFRSVAQAEHAAHGAYLELNRLQEETLQVVAGFQMAVIEKAQQVGHEMTPAEGSQPTTSAAPMIPSPRADVAFDREKCMEFAVGTIGKVLGPEFSIIDSYPTRVRLPDEPLMLVDRILEIEGERMTRGRVVTEHDVKHHGWYLDGGRIPTCIAVEAGQADLFLSAYLGIDFETKGKATYRLLDAEVTFHGELPEAGKVIHYDISIENFFRQGQTYLFRFRFDGTVDGEPLLTMRNGCAGFFSEAELAAGKGIVRNPGQVELKKQKAKGVQPLVPMVREAYNDDQLRALRDGDLVTCFGDQFAELPLQRPMTLPDGTMNLVDRVLALEPQGGPYGMGFIRAEADIHPDDWFLTCHFVDDKVMPGTLMYECCLHSLRIYLMRMGWLGEQGSVAYQPIPGVKSQLKCRGQVLETTKKVRYEIMIRELGYGPEPYAIVDALMYSDEKCIVEIGDMSIRLTGLTQASVEQLWDGRYNPAGHPAAKPPAGHPAVKTPEGHPVAKKPAVFDRESILAYAVGNPSEAFGEPYRVFDEQRIIARLPGPPFMLIDRLTAVETPPWKVQAGGGVQAQYDVPIDAWYFQENRGGIMPFSVLLEIALQPCGWMAAYMGSALTSDQDLKFRNLGGSATLLRPVMPTSGTLTVNIKATKVSSSGGMIIQNYDFEVLDASGPVYVGDTYFGFFSKAALAKQVGLRDASITETSPGSAFPYPQQAPYPADRMCMLDRVTLYQPRGGAAGLGMICGELDVDPSAWFFKAHFHQDPVIPGSLGLESFLQLLKIVADDRWQLPEDAVFETTACGLTHGWEYRGQVIPSNQLVKVEAEITSIDDAGKTLMANGILSVDGTAIYRMTDFSLRIG